jgi:hypothetical protein
MANPGLIATGEAACHTCVTMETADANYVIIFALVYFATMLLVAQHRAPPEYSPWRHTISQLASQGYERRRFMQTGFVVYGLLFVAGLLSVMLEPRTPLYRDTAHLVYGLALVPTGLFCSMPFRRHRTFSKKEAKVHAVSAKLSGAAFGLGIAVHALLSTGEVTVAFHVISVAVYMAGAVWFARTRNSLGAAQRLMYAYGSIWLLATYGTGIFLPAG